MAEYKSSASAFRAYEKWAAPVLLGWLLPGGGHFYLKRWSRGALLLFAIGGMFACGLLTRGRMFDPITGDLFTTIVNWGGYLSDRATGSLYFLATWLGYEQPRYASPVADYGTKFLVCAGLLNVLAIIDAVEIAVENKS